MTEDVVRGTLIAESLRVGSEMAAVPLQVDKIWRVAASATPEQPAQWTLLDFSAPAGEAGRLADAFSGCLADSGGWYVDFSTATEKFVVFAGQVFRYPRGDQAGRAEAAAYARSHGVPEEQTDWAD